MVTIVPIPDELPMFKQKLCVGHFWRIWAVLKHPINAKVCLWFSKLDNMLHDVVERDEIFPPIEPAPVNQVESVVKFVPIRLIQ